MISIVIPTYNNLDYLKLCLDSIKRNSFKDHEIFLHINDGSDGALSKAIEMGDVKGKNGESNLFYIDGKRIQLLGLGKKEELNACHYLSNICLRLEESLLMNWKKILSRLYQFHY